jgi:ribulose-5-phosphate 4-epimerase/fuculose-1-phosphate aldolase
MRLTAKEFSPEESECNIHLQCYCSSRYLCCQATVSPSSTNASACKIEFKHESMNQPNPTRMADNMWNSGRRKHTKRAYSLWTKIAKTIAVSD